MIDDELPSFHKQSWLLKTIQEIRYQEVANLAY